MEALNIRDRAALLAALPGPEYGPTARVTLKTCETRVLMAAAGEDSLDLSAQDTARQAA
ncbi:hypothetical protein O4H61_11420 [Roseovarius aestuarii]|nr:hypothetical protein [Roseovarius aestuarii]